MSHQGRYFMTIPPCRVPLHITQLLSQWQLIFYQKNTTQMWAMDLWQHHENLQVDSIEFKREWAMDLWQIYESSQIDEIWHFSEILRFKIRGFIPETD